MNWHKMCKKLPADLAALQTAEHRLPAGKSARVQLMQPQASAWPSTAKGGYCQPYQVIQTSKTAGNKPGEGEESGRQDLNSSLRHRMVQHRLNNSLRLTGVLGWA